MLQRPDHQTHPTRGKAKTPKKQVSWQPWAARSSSPKGLECQPKQYNSKASDNWFSMTSTTLSTDSVYEWEKCLVKFRKRQHPRILRNVSKDKRASIQYYFAKYHWILFRGCLDGLRAKRQGAGQKVGPHDRTGNWTMQPNQTGCPQMLLKTTFPATSIRLSEKNTLIL